jgi:flagellar protein FlaI
MSKQQAKNLEHVPFVAELDSEPKAQLVETSAADKTFVKKLYEIEKPYTYATITENPLTMARAYEVIEPTVTEKESSQMQIIRDFLIETLDITMKDFNSQKEASSYLEQKVRLITKRYRLKIEENSLNKILYYIKRDYIGFGKIDIMMKDEQIEDISCNGVTFPIYVWHREYESIPTNVSFGSDEELDSFITRLAYRSGKMVSMANPLVDAALPDGSRIQMSYGNQVTKNGSTFTIRKFKADPLTIVNLIKLNTLSSEMAALFWVLMENKCSLFVCGGIASGKTTMLNCLSSFIKPDAKIVTIEDTPEIKIYHKNWIRSVTRPTMKKESDISMFDLLKTAVRQRPDYIVVGEIRGEEAYTLFQAMATGHLGLSTLHADSARAAINRLETRPMDIPKKLVAELNLITVQERIEKDGIPLRRTVSTTEVVGLDPKSNEVKTNEIFRWNAKTDNFDRTGKSYYVEKVAHKLCTSVDEIEAEIEKRQNVLEWMVNRGINSFDEVTEVIRKFKAMPEGFYTTHHLREGEDWDDKKRQKR